jgi:hypothetical protein
MDRVKLSARLTVDLPAAEAMRLFTPEGEQLWAAGWEPRYPGGEGGVFVTGHEGHETVWVPVDSSASHVRYARVAPDDAGTVMVEIVPPGRELQTTLEVTYALDALDDDGREGLARFQAEFPAYIASWEADIRSALAGRPRG